MYAEPVGRQEKQINQSNYLYIYWAIGIFLSYEITVMDFGF